MRLKDRNVVIFVEKMYEDLEFWYPCLRLLEEGADVTVVAPEEGVYHGKHGVPARADQAVAAVLELKFDGLVIPGGYAPDHMRRSRDMVAMVERMCSEGKPVAAICHGPWMLASADVLQGRKVTSFHSIRDDLEHAGALWVDEEVVQDGNLITSREPKDLPAFCRRLIEALA